MMSLEDLNFCFGLCGGASLILAFDVLSAAGGGPLNLAWTVAEFLIFLGPAIVFGVARWQRTPRVVLR